MTTIVMSSDNFNSTNSVIGEDNDLNSDKFKPLINNSNTKDLTSNKPPAGEKDKRGRPRKVVLYGVLKGEEEIRECKYESVYLCIKWRLL